MPSANVIQLRQMLSEKFPGLRLRLEEERPAKNAWSTGIAAIDGPLRGGLPKGALTEVIGAGNHSGSATFLRGLLSRAAAEKRMIALVDGRDSFDVTQVEEAVLSRLLWVRCHSAPEAMKAADLILRDGNLSLVLLDLKLNPDARRIPATTWYRFQRLVEETGTLCVVFTSHSMIACAQARIALRSSFSLEALETDADELLRGLEFEISEARSVGEVRDTLQNSA
jgi:hypothetical protein